MNDELALRVAGLDLPGLEQLLGVRLEPPPAASFAVGEGTEITWTFAAATPTEAPELLARQERALAQSSAALEEAERSLRQLAQQRRAQSYAPPRSPAEGELLAEIRALETSAAAFAIRQEEEPEKRALRQQWQHLVTQLRRLVSAYAQIETNLAGEIVARTRVGWNGDLATLWQAAASPEMGETHRRAVQLALASRQSWLRLGGVIIGGAAGLALKATTPGGQLLLLPAVWKFVREIVQAWRQIESVQ